MSSRVAVIAFCLANLVLSLLASLLFSLGMLPGEALGALVPLMQWSVALIAWVIIRRSGSRPVRSEMAIRRGPHLGRGLVVALVVCSVVPPAQIALGALVGATRIEPRDGVTAVLLAVPIVLMMQCLFGAGEELGWRGYLHTQLRGVMGFWATAALTAVVWCLWHVPVAAQLALDGSLPFHMAATYVLDLAPIAITLAALRERYDSVWPAVLGHGLVNSVRVFVLQNLSTSEAALGAAQFWTLHAIGWVLWGVAGALLLKRRAGRRPVASHRPPVGAGTQ